MSKENKGVKLLGATAAGGLGAYAVSKFGQKPIEQFVRNNVISKDQYIKNAIEKNSIGVYNTVKWSHYDKVFGKITEKASAD